MIEYLIVNTQFKTSWAPLDQVEGCLGLERGDGGCAVSRDNIAAVEKSDSHILSIAGITDDHLVVGLEA